MQKLSWLNRKSSDFNNVAIVYVKGSACRIHFWHMSKDDVINVVNGSNVVHKMGVLYNFFIICSNEWM